MTDYSIPSDNHSISDTGHTSGHNSIADVLGLYGVLLGQLSGAGTNNDPDGNITNITAIQSAKAAANLSPATSGYVLTSNGPGSLPTFQVVSASVPVPLTLSGSAPSGGLLVVANTAAGPSAPSVGVLGVNSGDRALGVSIAGDSLYRWRVNTDGNHQWGTGSANTDVELFRSSAGFLTISPLSGAGGLVVTAAGSAASVHQVTNTQSSPGNPALGITTAASGDRALGVMVSGDANHRFAADSVGVLGWGPGSGTRDTILYRLGAGTLRTDNNFSVGGSILGGADTTAADIAPIGVQAAGSTGKLADAGHVHQYNSPLALYLAPTGATGETVPRYLAGSSQTPNTQTLTLMAIGLPTNLTVNKISTFVKATAANGVSHGFHCLLDNNLIVRAVSADQTSANPWGTANTTASISMTSPFTTTYGGLYYVGVGITASTMPTLATIGGIGQIGTVTPILCGTASTTFTTPPSSGSTIASITYNNSSTLYFYTS